MLKVKKVSFDYIRRDEEGGVEGITRALDEVELSEAGLHSDASPR